MELLNEEEFTQYVGDNYPLLFTSDQGDHSFEIDARCDVCQRDAYLKVHSKAYNTPGYRNNDSTRFTVFFLQCPSCKRKSFLHTIRLWKTEIDENGNETDNESWHFYRLYRLPTTEEAITNEHIPDGPEFKTLRESVREANYCLTNGMLISATIMFRRSIQIIAKHILGAKGSTLYKQLEWLKTNQNKLSIDLTDVFHDNAQLIKDIGNQGAHPEDDIELATFSESEANGLHDLFIQLIHEVFVKPSKLKELQEGLRKSRKLG